jgi:hypothetical protein
MFAANSYVIRHATLSDRDAIHRIARLDTQRPLSGQVLIGEIGGVAAAAISLEDGRVVADPFMRTANLTPLLRVRYRAHRSRLETPSLVDRLRAGARVRATAQA